MCTDTHTHTHTAPYILKGKVAVEKRTKSKIKTNTSVLNLVA